MDIKETQQDLKVFMDYDEKQRENTNWTQNDLKPATRTWPKAQTQQRETETKLHGTMKL